MKLPSLYILWISVKQVVQRFPLQILTVLLATGILYYLIGSRKDVLEEEYLYRLVLVCNLALTLLLAVDLHAEAKHFNNAKKWGLRLLVVLVSLGLYFLLYPFRYMADVYRSAFLVMATHLLVAFSPFIRKGNLNGFWQFNKTLFLRILTSGLYAGVLYAGLAVALLAIYGLFNVKFESNTYLRLLNVVFSGFMTIFFLAGLPRDFDALDQEEFYPKALKVFTQYVLIPLMTIYLAILLVYELKIIINWELPRGLVSSLVLGYAVFGILSLLLIYPIREKAGNGWMKLFSKFFYMMMIPLVILLLLAVWKRVGHYGITEPRYILIVLSFWLLFITGYFLLSKRQNIKVIPISLCILCILATYGPQSASSVSRYTQIKRLKTLLASKQDDDDRRKVVHYLVDNHGLTSLQSFTKVDLEEIETKMGPPANSNNLFFMKKKQVDTALVILKIGKGQSGSDNSMLTFTKKAETVISVKGYDYLVPIDNYNVLERVLNGIPLVIDGQGSDMVVKVMIGKEVKADFDVFSLGTALKKKYKQHNQETYIVPQEFMQITKTFDHYELTFVASSIKVYDVEESESRKKGWNSYSGFLLIKLK